MGTSFEDNIVEFTNLDTAGQRQWVKAWIEARGLELSRPTGLEDISSEYHEGYAIVFEEHEGGGEGDGSHTHIVVSLHKEGQKTPLTYIMFTGWHDSEWGTEWDRDFDFVEPYEVTVTRYRTI